MNPTISVYNIQKKYRMGKGLTSIRDLFILRNHRDQKKYYWALKDLSFQLFPGEALGVIGPNGAGKTTLLKILSKVTKPTNGSIDVDGRLSALIELGAGFHPDLTGRENVFLNGTILGMKKKEIKDRFDEIIDFAGIGDYLDTPVKRYSSGMYARLGFAIAAHTEPQVLLVDEVLAVGDYAFQQKCYARMEELIKRGTSIIIVSHNMEAVRRVCSKCIVLYKGECIVQDRPVEAIAEYSNVIRQAAKRNKVQGPVEDGLSQKVMTFDAEIERVSILNDRAQESMVIASGTRFKAVIDVVFHKDVTEPIFSCTVRSPDGKLVYDTTTKWMGTSTLSFRSGEKCRVEFELTARLLEGEYQLGVDITAADLSHYFDRIENGGVFWVTSADSAKGIADLDGKFNITRYQS